VRGRVVSIDVVLIIERKVRHVGFTIVTVINFSSQVNEIIVLLRCYVSEFSGQNIGPNFKCQVAPSQAIA
jgi:hypothetical protein